MEVNGQPAAPGPAGAQIVYTLKVDGNFRAASLQPQFTVVADAPFCATIEAMDLASGAVDAGEKHCFGEAVAGQLGPQALDPTEKLQCALQQCAPEGGPWDPMKCTPYEPETPPTTSDSDEGGESSGSGSGSDTAGEGEGDKGCGCNTGPGGDAGLLGLIGVVGLGRRRRRR